MLAWRLLILTAFGVYASRLRRDDILIKAVAALGIAMEELVKAKNAIHMYEDFSGCNLD